MLPSFNLVKLLLRVTCFIDDSQSLGDVWRNEYSSLACDIPDKKTTKKCIQSSLQNYNQLRSVDKIFILERNLL